MAKVDMSTLPLHGTKMMVFILLFIAVIAASPEGLHRRMKRGTRTSKSVCLESFSGRVFRGGDSWLRPAGKRVEFCRCEDGRRKCHSVPVAACSVQRCYNGGVCRQAVYSPDYLCQCVNGFKGENCETDTRETCYEGSGTTYRGTHSTTKSEAVCVNWNSKSLNDKQYNGHHKDAQQMGLGNHNYCRNPDNDNSPWCHVFKDGKYGWEYCNVPTCRIESRACYYDRGITYRGSQSVTLSGKRCLRWDSPLVQHKLFTAWHSNTRGFGIGSHNYCRNPDNDIRPWCYVAKGAEIVWELCDIQRCAYCGSRRPSVAQYRILSGKSVQVTSHPWQAAIYSVSKRGEIYRCGGTLIHNCWVMSAAHCFTDINEIRSLRVILGRTMRTVPGAEEQRFFVEQMFAHPDFDGKTFDNDIVLLRIRSASGICAVETESTRTACLPESGLALPDWTECEMSGFGKIREFSPFYSNQLKEGHVRLYPDRLCTPERLANRTVTPNMLCAGDTRNLDDACQGDSGGPLVCPHDDRMHILGIISWGVGCGKKDTPGVYTRVTRYLDWIQKHTGI